MEIVITIDEVNYKVACDLASDICPTTFRGLIYKAIANGTVLPKGHGRLIDANDVDNHIIGSVDLRDCPTIIEADKE